MTTEVGKPVLPDSSGSISIINIDLTKYQDINLPSIIIYHHQHDCFPQCHLPHSRRPSQPHPQPWTSLIKFTKGQQIIKLHIDYIYEMRNFCNCETNHNV